MIKDAALLIVIENIIGLLLSLLIIKRLKSSSQTNMNIIFISIISALLVFLFNYLLGTSNIGVTAGITSGITYKAIEEVLKRKNIGAALGIFSISTGLIIANFTEYTILYYFGVILICIGMVAAIFECFFLDK